MVWTKLYLKEKNEENNFYLIENSKWIKPRHLNKGKLNLNKNGSKILANNFIGEISKVFNRQSERDSRNAAPGECTVNKTLCQNI